MGVLDGPGEMRARVRTIRVSWTSLRKRARSVTGTIPAVHLGDLRLQAEAARIIENMEGR
jgi:hypothetical protein